MKRRQQDAQAKAAKHYSTEKRQQETQAMAAKHKSESITPVYQECSFHSVLSNILLLLCIHVQLFEVHTVVVNCEYIPPHARQFPYMHSVSEDIA